MILTREPAIGGVRCNPGVAMLLSSLMFVAMGVQVKALAALGAAYHVPDFEISFIRFLFGLVFMTALAAVCHISLRTNRAGPLLLRALVSTCNLVAYFYAIGHGQLTTATLLSYTYVVFAALFSAVWLQEWPTSGAVCAMAVATAGTVVLLRPDFHHIGAGEVAGLVSGVCGGLATTLMRDLRRTETTTLIFFSYSLCGVLATGVPLLLGALRLAAFEAPRLPPPGAIALLCGAGLTGSAGQVLITWGLRYTSTLLSALISLAAVPLTAVAGMLFFHERLYWNALVGGLMVLGAAFYLSVADGTLRLRSAEPQNPV